MKSPLITSNREPTPEEMAFVSVLQGEDDLGCILRVVMHLEAMLTRLIEAVVPNPKELTRLQLDYDKRVTLAVVLGTSKDVAPSLRAIGTLRNRFAHRLDMSLTKDDVKGVYDAMTPFDRTMVNKHFQYLRDAGHMPVKSYANLVPRDQLALVALVLRLLLDVGAHQQQAVIAVRTTS